MASPYSYRSRHSAEHRDSYSSRSRDHDYGYSDYAYSSQTPSSSYSYSTRTVEPPEHELPHRRRSRRHATRRDSYRRRWPPAPSVEDELDYLQREFGSISQSDDVRSQASMRGDVDQDPIMIELEPRRPLVPLYPEEQNDEKRFVLVTDPTRNPGTTKSSTTRGREGRRKGPPLKTDLADPPVRLHRERSPYAYSKPSTQTSGPGISSEGLLTPDAAKQNSSGYSRSSRSDRGKSPREPSRYGDASLSPNDADRSRQKSSRRDRDLEAEQKDAETILLHRKPSRYSFTPGDTSPKVDSERSERQERRASPRTSRTWPSSSTSPESSSSEHAPNPPPRPQRAETMGGPRDLPRGQPSSRNKQKASGTAYSSSSASPSYSRPSSPRVVDQKPYPPSPSRSPHPQEQASRKLSGTRPRSGTNSRPTSPLAMPSMPSMSDRPPLPPRVNSLNSQRAPTPTSPYRERPPQSPIDDRSRPPSRLHPQARQESMPVPPRIDVQSPSPARPPVGSNPLPYPVEDTIVAAAMPVEEAFQVQSPTEPDGYAAPFSPRDGPSNRNPTPNFDKTQYSTRPSSATAARPEASSAVVAPKLEPRQRKLSVSLMEPMQPCPRPQPTSRYDDWYSLEGYPAFAICPDCLDSIFHDTRFIKEFKRSYRVSSSTRIKCNFSSPWMRIAWLLTLQQERKDLELIYRLARIAEIDDPCPGDREAVGTWYGLLDTYGTLVSGFYICPCDVRQVEALFPSLKGAFIRIPQQEFKREPHLCSLRVNTRRFAGYLDALIEVDSKARDRYGSTKPDMRPFIQLARDNAFRNECPRDALVLNQVWHVMPALPEFTVCEECFDEVVWPAIAAGSKVAEEFNRDMEYISDEHHRGGTSCQLYSPRMRKIWQVAVEEDDWGYLVKKAKERAQVETELQSEHHALLRLLDVAKRERERGASGEDVFMVKEQLARLARDWKRFE